MVRRNEKAGQGGAWGRERKEGTAMDLINLMQGRLKTLAALQVSMFDANFY